MGHLTKILITAGILVVLVIVLGQTGCLVAVALGLLWFYLIHREH